MIAHLRCNYVCEDIFEEKQLLLKYVRYIPKIPQYQTQRQTHKHTDFSKNTAGLHFYDQDSNVFNAIWWNTVRMWESIWAINMIIFENSENHVFLGIVSTQLRKSQFFCLNHPTSSSWKVRGSNLIGLIWSNSLLILAFSTRASTQASMTSLDMGRLTSSPIGHPCFCLYNWPSQN